MFTIAGAHARHDLDMLLPSDPTAPALARASVREFDGTLSSTLVDKLSLVATELVTNALRHAVAVDPAPKLTLEVGNDRVVLTVADDGSLFDRTASSREPSVDGGFGLPLVDSIADRWWIEYKPTTRVVCEFARDR
jgi:two-component sensor histidine kinase